MKTFKEIFVQFFCYIVQIVLHFTETNSDPIYVCPVDMQISSKLIDYRKVMMCNDVKDFNSLCGLKKEFTSSYTYQDTVIIVHNEKWSYIKNMGDKLSSCGISYLTMDIADTQFDLSSFCSLSRTTLIFSVTNETNNFLDKWSFTKTCSVKNTNINSAFFTKLTNTCPSSIFVTGATVCDIEIASYALKLQGKITSTSDNSSEKSEQSFRIVERSIRVGALEYVPFVNFTLDNGTLTYEGVVKEMMDKIVKTTGFTYTIVQSPGNKAGIYSNGSWDGLIGMLLRKEIDMIAAPLTVTYSRSEVVNFSPPYYFESIGIMIKKPTLVPRLWRAFTLFTVSLWAVIAAASILTVILLYVLHVYAAMPTDTGFEKFADCVWYVVACMSNQAHEINPGPWSAQNYLAFWWLYVVAIIAIYGGVLISLLTNKTTPLPFTTLTELSAVIQNDGYKVCIQGSTGFHDRILTSNAPEHTILRNWLLRHPEFVTSATECTNKLINLDNVAYLAEVTRLQEMQKANCDQELILLNDRFFPGWFSFAYQKSSPLLAMQMQTISEVIESGLIDGWKLKYSNKTKPCRILTVETMNSNGGSSGLNMDPLSLQEVGGPFVLLTVGLVVSLIFFLIELNREHKRRMRNQEQLKVIQATTAKVIKVVSVPKNGEMTKDKGMYFTYNDG